MALTITESPYETTLHGQVLRIVANSDNITESGFRYYVTVYDEGLSIFLSKSYIQPDPNDYLDYNLNSVINIINYDGDGPFGNIHDAIDPYVEVHQFGWKELTVSIYESWNIAGVLTINEASVETIGLRVINGNYQISDGYKPDPDGTNTDTSLSLLGNTYRWLSDRKWNTHKCKYASAFFLAETDRTCFIPVRETDYGILMYLFEKVADGATIQYIIYDASGVPHTATIAMAGQFLEGVGVYPANLNASTIVPKPSLYPNWRFYTVKFMPATGSTALSITYAFYNAELFGQHDCQHDTVRIGWVNSRGGWDYFNFIKKNEISNAIERKSYKKVLQSPDLPYEFSVNSATEVTRHVNNVQSLNVTSAPIQENEFVFLRSLMVSRQVHWIHDDGTHTPMILSTDNYIEQRERKPKLKTLELTFRIAQQYWT